MRLRIICDWWSVAFALLLAANGCGGESAKSPLAGTKYGEKAGPDDVVRAGTETTSPVQGSVGPNGEGGSVESHAVQIPLDQIWALHTPGTKSIFKLDPDGEYNSLTSLPSEEIVERWKNSILRQITEALSADSPDSDWPKEHQTAKPGFAVSGTGVDALREANDIMVKHTPPRGSFQVKRPLSLVLFSYAMGGYPAIESVERRGNSIEVRYRLAGPNEKSLAVGFALIPIGSLEPGDYRVAMTQLPTGRERDAELGQRFICKSFNFSVVADGQQSTKLR